MKLRWINDRWPLSVVLRAGLEEEIPSGSRYAYTLGSATLFLLVLQIITGILELFFYVPTVDHAYSSLAYLRLQVPFGWLIHGIHYWGAQAFIVVMGLHMIRVFVWAAYKKPRELVWISGVALLLLGVGIKFTGGLLPWDMAGYRAAEVGTNISGQAPVVGPLTLAFLRGGESMGQATLSRFFALHVAVFPILIISVLAFHMVAFRRAGHGATWETPVPPQPAGWFWPDQIFKDLVVAGVVLLVLIGLEALVRSPITGPADPLDTIWVPKPEWNFLFLYQSLKAFPGNYEALGSVGIPTVLVGLLLLLPFVDRNPERNPKKRPITIAIGSMIALAFLILTTIGYYSNPAASAAPAKGGSPAPLASTMPAPARNAGPATIPTIANAENGKKLFSAKTINCIGCHTIDKVGGDTGPDLSDESHKGRDHAWLIVQLTEPETHNPATDMPSFATKLKENELNDVVAYLLTLSKSSTTGTTKPGQTMQNEPANGGTPNLPSPAIAMLGGGEHGKLLYTQFCITCHAKDGVGGIDNLGSDSGKVPRLQPIDKKLFSSDPSAFISNIDPIIQHGAQSAGPNPQKNMPAFGDSGTLTQPQIANLEAYILELNGIDRAHIDQPGVEPVRFSLIALAAFAGTGLLLGGIWLLGRRPGKPTV